MAKHTAQQQDAEAVASNLRETAGLAHLRVRRRADLIVIESGPDDDPNPRARLRRVGVHQWRLEMATHTGRWETTPFQAQRDELVQLLVENFGWTLAPFE
jgi:hypothetical protein